MDLADSGSLRSVPPTPMLDFTANVPMPTPMPGTNLSLEDVNPAIVVHSPSVTSTTKKTSQEPFSYFDIPRNDHVIVQHAGDPAATAGVTAAPGKSYRVGTLDIHDNKNTPGSERSVVPVIPAQPSDVSTAGCSGDIVPQNHSRAHKNRSSETSNENGGCEYRTLRYRRANGTIAERRIILRSDGEPHQDIRSESDADDYDYTAWDAMSSTTGTSGSNGLQRRRSTWSRHTGLYDGTGYGDDSPLTSEPGSPLDGGASDVHGRHEAHLLGKQPVSLKDDDKSSPLTMDSADSDENAGPRPTPVSEA
jgi:hypothetical protein